MNEVNAFLDATSIGAGGGCIALAMLLVVVALNAAADRKHRENAQWMQESGADQSPIVRAHHTTNGCMGVLMWLGAAAMLFALMSAIAGGG